MEVTFTEINSDFGDNIHNNSNTNANFLEVKKENTGYWENNVVEVKKKKKVTYDDILTSLNLVVAPNGVLQYMNAKPNTLNDDNNQQQYAPQSILKNPVTQEKIQPQVKHSYIYNKYFKSYKDVNVTVEEPRKPMTREEYQKMVIDDLIKKRIAQKRVAQIKSKQMAFTNNNQPIYASRNNLNHLFKF
jgi:hypothetical protein